MIKDNKDLTSAYETILLALASFLLKNGVSHREFSERSKWAFFEAGKEVLTEKQQYSMNQLLEMTGLTRNEIVRASSYVRSDDNTADTVWINAMRVLHKWYTHSEFLDKTGRPRDLDLSDEELFKSLFNLEASDIKGKELLRELTDSGSIKRLGELWRVESRYYIPKKQELMFHHFGQAVSRLISTLDRNINNPLVDAWIERSVSTADLKPESKPFFTRVSREQALKFLEGIDDWLSSNEEEHVEKTDAQVSDLGLGVYYFERDS